MTQRARFTMFLATSEVVEVIRIELPSYLSLCFCKVMTAGTSCVIFQSDDLSRSNI